MREIDHVSADVVDAAVRIHRDLGLGLLESVYELVLAGNLSRLGYEVERQKPISIEYDGMRFPNAFRLDLLVDRRLIVEIKTVERMLPVHAKQLLTYLRLTGQPVGLILNFSGETMKQGIRRVVNNHNPEG